MKRTIFILSALICLSSCGGSLDIKGLVAASGPDANERFAVSDAYNKSKAIESFNVDTDNYRVYVCADAHILQSSEGLTKFVEDYMADGDAAPFALFLGDALDGKIGYDNYAATVGPVEAGGRRLFSALGNHDIFYKQWNDYVAHHKTATYLFEVNTPSAGRDLYICLDSASGTLGTSQRTWLGNVLAESVGKYRNTIIFTHTHFFKRDNSQGHTGNFNLEETYDLAKLFSDNGICLVLTGHDHSFEETVFKGVKFLTLAAIADYEEEAYYYMVDVKDNETNLTTVRIK